MECCHRIIRIHGQVKNIFHCLEQTINQSGDLVQYSRYVNLDPTPTASQCGGLRVIVADSDIKCRNVWPHIKSVTLCHVALLETDLCLCLVFATAALPHTTQFHSHIYEYM